MHRRFSKSCRNLQGYFMHENWCARTVHITVLIWMYIEMNWWLHEKEIIILLTDDWLAVGSQEYEKWWSGEVKEGESGGEVEEKWRWVNSQWWQQQWKAARVSKSRNHRVSEFQSFRVQSFSLTTTPSPSNLTKFFPYFPYFPIFFFLFLIQHGC